MMGRKTLKEGKTELLTTRLDFTSLVGESVLRFFLTKDLIIEEGPAKDNDRPIPLGDLSARVSLFEMGIEEKDKAFIQGKVEGRAVFYSAVGPREVGWETEDFFREAGVPGALPGMTVSGHGRITFLENSPEPLEAEGKWLYQLQMEVEILLAISDPQQLEIAVGAKNILPEQVTREVISAEELLGERDVSQILTSELDFPEQLNYIKTLSCSLADFSHEETKEGFLIKGEVAVMVYFVAGKERGFREDRLPFSQQVSFPLKKGAEAAFYPRVEYVSHDLLGKKARQRISLDIYLRVTHMIQQEVLADIREGEVKKEYLLLQKPLGVVREPLELVQRLTFPYPQEITAGPCRLMEFQVEIRENAVIASGVLEKTIYYVPAPERERGEGEEESQWPLAIKIEENFDRSLQLPGLKPGNSAMVYFDPGKTEFAPVEGATLQVTHAELMARTWEMNEYPVVIPYRVPPETSLVIYAVRKGDTLLKIARMYGVKTSTIIEANSLGDESPPPAGSKLLIPLFY
ncbi:MAG TPA: LysM peptidoglycan-binding domain-containing protein [Firmicutes bacterium]|nr:LysM peptidoglycan-binding domain-containing protein [Bacillota bacterium]